MFNVAIDVVSRPEISSDILLAIALIYSLILRDVNLRRGSSHSWAFEYLRCIKPFVGKNVPDIPHVFTLNLK